MKHRKSKYTIIERVTHWFHSLSLLLLGVSGWYIYAPETCPFFSSMDSARLMHFVMMYLYFFVGLFHVYYYFIMNRYGSDSIHLSDLKDLPFEIKSRYLLMRDQEGEFHARFSPLEKLVYEAVFVLAALEAATGFLIYFYKHPLGIELADRLVVWTTDIFGGMQYIKAGHVIFAWLFVLYFAVHIYFVLTEDPRAVLEMIIGRRRFKKRS